MFVPRTLNYDWRIYIWSTQFPWHSDYVNNPPIQNVKKDGYLYSIKGKTLDNFNQNHIAEVKLKMVCDR